MSPLFEVLRQWPEGFTRSVPDGPWIDAAIRHGAALWVTDALALGKLAVPTRLSDAARGQLAQARKHRRFTLEVLAALNRAGVVPLLLKGYGLASRIYAAPLSRPAVDVDVFVRPGEEARAAAALAALGLVEQPDAALDDVHEDHHHTSWASRDGLVELHHRLASGFGGRGYDDAALAARAVDAQLEGQRVQYLSTEDELLYLAVHAATHAFLRVSWLMDLRLFIDARPQLDWALLVERAREAELVRPLRAALVLAQRLGARVPPLSLRWSLRERTDDLVFSDENVASARWASAKVPAFLLHLYLAQTPGQVVRHVWAGTQRALRRARAAK